MFSRIKLVSWSRDGRAKAFKLNALLQGFIWALTCTAFISAALSFWVVIGGGQVYHFSSIVAVGVLAGSFFGGAVSGRAAGSQGWLHGGAVGIFYCLVLFLFFAAWGGGYFSLTTVVTRLLVPVVLAVLGGIVGVNLRSFQIGRESYFSRMR